MPKFVTRSGNIDHFVFLFYEELANSHLVLELYLHVHVDFAVFFLWFNTSQPSFVPTEWFMLLQYLDYEISGLFAPLCRYADISPYMYMYMYKDLNLEVVTMMFFFCHKLAAK